MDYQEPIKNRRCGLSNLCITTTAWFFLLCAVSWNFLSIIYDYIRSIACKNFISSYQPNGLHKQTNVNSINMLIVNPEIWHACIPALRALHELVLASSICKADPVWGSNLTPYNKKVNRWQCIKLMSHYVKDSTYYFKILKLGDS